MMNYNAARQMVLTDQRESWSGEDMTDEEIIENVRATISLTSSGPGWVQLDDDGSELAEAYRIILSSNESRNEVIDRTRFLTAQLAEATDASRVDKLQQFLKINYDELAAIMRVRIKHNL
jgi:hypothetical protein